MLCRTSATHCLRSQGCAHMARGMGTPGRAVPGISHLLPASVEPLWGWDSAARSRGSSRSLHGRSHIVPRLPRHLGRCQHPVFQPWSKVSSVINPPHTPLQRETVEPSSPWLTQGWAAKRPASDQPGVGVRVNEPSRSRAGPHVGCPGVHGGAEPRGRGSGRCSLSGKREARLRLEARGRTVTTHRDSSAVALVSPKDTEPLLLSCLAQGSPQH